jgi:hypothetical protein
MSPRLAVLLALAPWAHPVTAHTQAQAPDPAVARAAIAKLGFMVGRWRGDAWQLRGNERIGTAMLEVVEPRLGGTVLLVEGRGSIQDSTGAEHVVHHALGILSHDPATQAYTLRSYLSTGQLGDFAVTLLEDGVQWSRAVPGGQVRNTARFTREEWHEVGEFSRDGLNWLQVMEIRLRREP